MGTLAEQLARRERLGDSRHGLGGSGCGHRMNRHRGLLRRKRAKVGKQSLLARPRLTGFFFECQLQTPYNKSPVGVRECVTPSDGNKALLPHRTSGGQSSAACSFVAVGIRSLASHLQISIAGVRSPYLWGSFESFDAFYTGAEVARPSPSNTTLSLPYSRLARGLSLKGSFCRRSGGECGS